MRASTALRAAAGAVGATTVAAVWVAYRHRPRDSSDEAYHEAAAAVLAAAAAAGEPPAPRLQLRDGTSPIGAKLSAPERVLHSLATTVVCTFTSIVSAALLNTTQRFDSPAEDRERLARYIDDKFVW